MEPPVSLYGSKPRVLVGVVEFEGAADYLPRSLQSEAGSDVLLRYTCTASTSRDDYPVLVALYNPLTLFGFPTGENTAMAHGGLEIVRHGQTVRAYGADVAARRRVSIYTSDSLTALRRTALLALRDSIDGQISRDAPEFDRLLYPPNAEQEGTP